jgi:hypothetical protein
MRHLILSYSSRVLPAAANEGPDPATLVVQRKNLHGGFGRGEEEEGEEEGGEEEGGRGETYIPLVVKYTSSQTAVITSPPPI